ncbi:EKC/KEOPS complex subunit Tprkb-like [Spodoptera litura]|uniref:EKC/KEOPS complex subunit Tprkb-like n=1 Tax=Spodoptera litura TaxID=69820 RepID=A0A9J7ESC9_SPOLT|nr:EKC/KEOPS complex subunit Tprkb-like [Spodoptera litura]
MTPEPYIVELDPDTKTTLKIYLFENVRNAEVIRNNIIQGVWKCSAIKPELIIDPFQVAVAANKAVLSEKHNTMVTRTVFSEILYNLSITKNITQSLTRFGIEKDTNLLLCFLVTESLDTSTEILSQIEGECTSISDLKKFTSMKNLNNQYKLNTLEKNAELTDIIVSRMVTKSFVTH